MWTAHFATTRAYTNPFNILKNLNIVGIIWGQELVTTDTASLQRPQSSIWITVSDLFQTDRCRIQNKNPDHIHQESLRLVFFLPKVFFVKLVALQSWLPLALHIKRPQDIGGNFVNLLFGNKYFFVSNQSFFICCSHHKECLFKVL